MSVPSPLSTAMAALVVCLSGGGTACAASGPLDPFLPQSGTIRGHVVTFAVAPEDQAISKRFQLAVQQNMDWFKKAVTSNSPGQPLAYDSRMAISPAEYDRLLKMTPALREGSAVTVAIDRSADGTVRFKPEDATTQGLKDVAVAPSEKVVATPFGQLSVFNTIHQANGASPWGAWNGVEWAQVMPADADQPSAKIGFGRRDADGQGVMYYQIAPFQDHAEQSLVILYKLD